MSSSYSYLDWVLSDLAHFIVHRFIFVYVFIFAYFCILQICRIIVASWGGPDGIEA